jgi:D-glycero-D-manno-heptose 1,7-bisphosphate phosphatase
MCNEFIISGTLIEKVYFSPFHPTEGLGKYKKDDLSRKPKPGMILEAERELNLDLASSILIGDKSSDSQAGISAGVGLNLLFAQKEPSDLSGQSYRIISTLREVLPFINSRC